ncbi:MAG: Ig-like domain-containing protein [Clostridia bacterium]|nr:Ig-like domain-containing protein [Clostridia bacterium]
MTKKIISLILCLPLILMVCLFSVSNSVSIAISIPVSKIEIFGDKIVYLDLDINEKYAVDYAVYPINAKNKEVYFETEQVGTSPLAELEYVNGYIFAKSCGKAKVYLTTIDGGFRDSFIVQVDSNKLQSISCEIELSSIYVGNTTRIVTTFVPENNINSVLKYQISDLSKNIVSVSASGVVTGLSKGVAEITVMSAENENIKDTVVVEVKNKDIIDFEKEEITTWKKEGSVNISLDTTEQCSYSYKVYDENDDAVDSSVVDVELNLANQSSGRISIDYSFKDKSFVGEVFVEVTVQTEGGLNVSKVCKISCINSITAQFENSATTSVKAGGTAIQPFAVTPNDANVGFDCTISNDNISVTVDGNNSIILVHGNKLGVSTISLKIYNQENEQEFVTITKEIVVTTQNIDINESAKTYGIENVFTIGKTETDGTVSQFNLTLAYGGQEVGENFTNHLSWVSSSENAIINSNGTITLAGDSGEELVQFKAVFEYQGVKIESSPFAIKCVYDGVNVRNYLDLWQETNKATPKPIVLHNNIKEDFAVGVANYYKEITTTYDKTYYENIGSVDKAKIKILIEFKNDVYGNGYTINAHNVAWGKNLQNATTNAVFGGPLNFVAMSENGGMISVKAQDNVCFAVYENVTLSNIELKGCDLQADGNNEYDLNDLTYTGTTVEVFGNNVNIQYSRISNGRTVLRAFGDINDSSKAININIKNSVLSGAREFVLRLGSNCFVDGSVETPSPYLPNDELKTFPVQRTYETMSESEKVNYDNAFIKTFVTLKNVVLKDAGIFAIGLDAHFAGTALADGSSYLGGLVKDWYNLAKTSYGVKLTFEGDVKMYNWTKIENVDSSTLIETYGPTTFTEISFDVAEMIDVISQNPKFSSIIYQDPDTQTKYVHGGIAFFGGGKNYSVFECSQSNINDLNGYEINLSDVDKTMLQVAAGSESFYFMINDATTQTFLPKDQEEILKSNDAYSCIYK